MSRNASNEAFRLFSEAYGRAWAPRSSRSARDLARDGLAGDDLAGDDLALDEFSCDGLACLAFNDLACNDPAPYDLVREATAIERTRLRRLFAMPTVFPLETPEKTIK